MNKRVMAPIAPDHRDAPADMAAEMARHWIVRMASGDMRADELAAFKTWRAADRTHNAAFEQQRALWRELAALENLAAPGDPAAPDMSAAVGRWRWPARLARRALAGAAALAAGIALLVMSGLGPDLTVWLRADHRTGHGVAAFTLPDGTQALLDANSAIAVRYTAGERRIELLRGDAWFDTTHGDRRPFRVAALGGVTEDIGTAFEVRWKAERILVAVTAGSVRVAAPAEALADAPTRVELHAGERASYGRDGPILPEGRATPAEIAPWRQGALLLDGAGVATAIEQIARYRSAPVFVIGDTTAIPPISAAFRTDRPDEALQAVAAMSHLRMFRLPGDILLIRPPAE